MLCCPSCIIFVVKGRLVVLPGSFSARGAGLIGDVRFPSALLQNAGRR
jgi:hypothetical protein